MSATPIVRRPCRGFTLIELLVVIAIIAVLIGLLLPAVQKVRTAAARARGMNNLKQIALGSHSFHDSFQRIPSNGYGSNVSGWSQWGGPSNPKSGSWAFMILPYLEQNRIYELGCRGVSTTPVGDQTQRLPVKTYICPARNRKGWIDGNPVGNGGYGSTTDYAINCKLHAPNSSNSVSMDNPPVNLKLSDIPGGTANTVFYGQAGMDSTKYMNDDLPSGCYRETWWRGAYGGAGRNNTASQQDYPGAPVDGWGSPFPVGGLYCMMDGGVRTIRYGIDLTGAMKASDGVVLTVQN